MPEGETEQGKKWILETCKRIAADLDISIDLDWVEKRPYVYSLQITHKNRTVEEEFRRSELDDCAYKRSRELRSDIEARIRKILRAFGPRSKRIGF